MNKIFLAIYYLFLLTSCSTSTKLDVSKVRSYTFQLENEVHDQAPYVAKYKKGNKELYYVASEHISSKKYPNLLDHPTLKTIEIVFQKFKPKFVIIEGLDPSKTPSKSIEDHARDCKEKKFENCGESIFAISKSVELGVPYISGEPNESQIYEEISKYGYSIDDLLGFYLVRQIPQIKRSKQYREQNLQKELELQIKKSESRLSVKTDFNFEKFKKWYSAHMSKPKDFYELENDDPAPHGGLDATYVQKISNKVTFVRDQTIIKKIEGALNKYDRVLIVYGGSHLLTQEKSLNEALGAPEYLKWF